MKVMIEAQLVQYEANTKGALRFIPPIQGEQLGTLRGVPVFKRPLGPSWYEGPVSEVNFELDRFLDPEAILLGIREMGAKALRQASNQITCPEEVTTRGAGF